MIEPISWLHISDIHIKVDQKWSQDVILSSMCDEINRRVKAGEKFHFILISGDLTFSGQTDEFILCEDFLNQLSKVSAVPMEMIFCIPGNHDIERKRQKATFRGTHQILKSQNDVDAFISDKEEIDTLLKRLENYFFFIGRVFISQKRTVVSHNSLGFISKLSINGIDITVIALNSAWLANGGPDDHGQLLIGERQVIDAIRLANAESPNIVVSMAHHPMHLLKEFDRTPVQNRISENCHFFHCGHLHTPENRDTRTKGAQCIISAAGASYETRTSKNSFSIITLDVLQATSTVTVIGYDAHVGKFSNSESLPYFLEISPSKQINLAELAEALTAFDSSVGNLQFYLAALLLNLKSEFIVPIDDKYVFGSLEVIRSMEQCIHKEKTLRFIGSRNIINLLSKTKSLKDILKSHGEDILSYCKYINGLRSANSDLDTQIDTKEKEAMMLAKVRPTKSFHHTQELFKDLSNNGEWDSLKNQAKKYLDSSDSSLSLIAKRFYALSLSHSSDKNDTQQAVSIYKEMFEKDQTGAEDLAMYSALLINEDGGDINEAKKVLLYGVEKYPKSSSVYSDLAQKIVTQTGDREFRQQFENVKAKIGI